MRTESRRFRVSGPTLVGMVIGMAMIGMVALYLEVSKDLRLLHAASSDNVQWTISHAEVEYLDYRQELDLAINGGRNLDALRRRFDIFYSRINMLSTSQLYRGLTDTPEARTAFSTVEAALEAGVTLIDLDDAGLIAALPDLDAATGSIRDALRTLSTSGLRYSAQKADTYRAWISTALVSLATVTLVLIVTLLLLALYFSIVSRQNIRRRAEVQQSSARLEAVINTSLDAVLVTDRTGRILEFNTAAEQIFGHDRTSAVGQPIGELIVPHHLRGAHDAGMARMAQGAPRRVVGKGRVRIEGLRASGDVFPVELSIQSAERDGSEIFVAFLRDISALVQAERELTEARDRALAGEKAKANFLAVMSHEIRTPLNGLLGNLALLRDTALAPAQRDYIRRMDLSGRLLMNHVNDVLDIAKYDAGKLVTLNDPVDLDELMRDLIDAMRGNAEASGIALHAHWVGAPQRWIRSDRARVEQLLLNFIGNAIKFTSRGCVTVETEVLSRDGGTAQLEFRVIDTGIGISEDDIGRIFADFETLDSSFGRKVGGTGLGLGIARRISAAMGGEIGARSTLGEGSVFWFRMPAEIIEGPAAAASPHPALTAPQHSADAGPDPHRITTAPKAEAPTKPPPRRILVVEDNEINRHVVREMLQRDGHTVIEASNGQEAVRMADHSPFDLILMDISMPVMDGREATRAIRSGTGANAAQPIVALTANVMPGDIDIFREVGMDGALSKPLSADALRAAVSQFTEGGSAPAAEAAPASLIDPQQFSETFDLIGKDACATFLAQLEAEMDDLVTWLTGTPDAPRDIIAARCHKLSSSAGTFGAFDLQRALRTAEIAGRDPARTGLEEACRAVGTLWNVTRQAFRTMARP